jgi:restriction system protein
MAAWVVRAGVAGERDAWALTNGLAGGGFIEFPDLTNAKDRNAVQAIANVQMAGDHPQRIANFTGQMWAIRGRIKPGDLIVLPLKTTRKIALGLCTGGYRYLGDLPEDQRHTIQVDWKRTDVPRSALKDDLLNTLNGAMTIFSATRNGAAPRLRAVLESGIDPGVTSGGGNSAPAPTAPGNGATVDEDPVDPIPAVTVEAIRDRVRTALVENFGGHKLTGLIADILRAEGFTCSVSPPGPDYGVDILAGSGPLGLDSPTLVVEVKSESTQVGVPVLNQLQGAVTSHQADQALLVAWGGLSKQAEQLRMTQRLRVQVWTDEDVLDRLFDTYERLPDTTKSMLPLKRAWVLVQETG